jgi:hypothetical protein
MSNDIGSRGESIFGMLVSRYFDPFGFLFKPIFLGEKYPTVDFYVDLLSYTDKKGFFFASIKTTTQGYTADKTKLKVYISKEELRELSKFPVPVYIFGIDAIAEKGYFVCANDIDTDKNMNGISLKYPIDRPHIIELWEEVKQFWVANSSIYTFTSKFK